MVSAYHSAIHSMCKLDSYCHLLFLGAVQLSCDDNSGVLIGYSTDSIVVQVPVNGTYDIVPIHGCTGPPLCQEDPTLCRPLIIGGKSLVISAVGSLVFFNLATPSQDPYVVSITRSCTPTNLVLVTDDEEDTSYLWVACISDSLPSLMYLSYSLSFSGDGEVISASFINQLPEVSLSESSTSFSESILLPDLCSTSGNFRLYVVHDDFIWYFPVSPGVVREFVRSDVQLENCSSVSYIEHSDASEGITIHCSSSGVVVSYSTCSEDAQYHSLAVDGIPYSCGTGSVRYRTDSIEVLGADDDDSTSLRQFDHTLGIITYGRCYGDFFTVITASGSLYIVQLAGTASGEVTKLADVCDDTSCVSPAFGSTGLLVYDVSDSALFPVSVLDACASPVVGTPYSIQRPSYVSISSTGSSTCDCTTVPVPMTTGTPTESENPPKMDENKDEKKIVALSVVIPLVCIIVAVIGVAIILYKW